MGLFWVCRESVVKFAEARTTDRAKEFRGRLRPRSRAGPGRPFGDFQGSMAKVDYPSRHRLGLAL